MMQKEEDQAIITMVRDFAERELSPAVSECDSQAEPKFPARLIAQIEELGLTTITAPEECGGAGLDLTIAGLITEEMATVCPGFATIVASSLLGIAPLFFAGDIDKAGDLLQIPAADDEPCRLAAILLPDTGRPITIAATPDGDGFVLNGSSTFVLNGGVASLYTAFASLGEEIICCAIPANTPGLGFSQPIRKLGLSVVPCCDLVLENVPVPADYVLAGPAEGRATLTRVEMQRHGIIGATAVGCTRAAIRETTAYANQRWQGGQFIIHHDAVGSLLADMAIGLQAARAFVRGSLDCTDDLLGAVLARIHATETACATATDAVQVFGGYGYMRDLPVEKLMRDSRQLALVGGGNGWLRIQLQRNLK